MEEFNEEYAKIMKDYPKLKFTFPSKKELEEIRQINYITKDEKTKQEWLENITALRKLVHSKNTYLPEDLKKEVKKLLEEN